MGSFFFLIQDKSVSNLSDVWLLNILWKHQFNWCIWVELTVSVCINRQKPWRQEPPCWTLQCITRMESSSCLETRRSNPSIFQVCVHVQKYLILTMFISVDSCYTLICLNPYLLFNLYITEYLRCFLICNVFLIDLWKIHHKSQWCNTKWIILYLGNKITEKSLPLFLESLEKQQEVGGNLWRLCLQVCFYSYLRGKNCSWSVGVCAQTSKEQHAAAPNSLVGK